jgi:hypothetical protein
VNRKHRNTLTQIFRTPTVASIKFSDIERLLVALGGELTEGSGSRICFEVKGLKLFVHRPHPGKEAKKYQVEAFREFLELVGVKDE